MKPRPIPFNEMWQVVKEGEDGLMARSSDGLRVVASWGGGWDHVSVSRASRCPDWNDMCRVKDLFFEAEECVVQYHPPRSTYKNVHKFCLHLWKPQGLAVPMPMPEMVAP